MLLPSLLLIFIAIMHLLGASDGSLTLLVKNQRNLNGSHLIFATFHVSFNQY